MEQRDLLSNDLLINENTQVNLSAAAKWGKFLSIVGFIACALMLIGGVYIASGMSALSTYSYGNDAARVAGITYIITAIILLVPCFYLNKFSNKTQEAIKSTNQESLDTAIINLKSMFKFYGIVTIVFLAIFALAFLAGIGGALVS